MGQQINEDTLIATKLLNRLATTELEVARAEVKIDELNKKVAQLTGANQKLENENQQLKMKDNSEVKGEE